MPESRNRSKAPSFREAMRRNRQSVRAKRISNRELARRADFSIQSGSQVFSVLMAVLAQTGGITVTKGTLEQVGENMRYLNYKVSPIQPDHVDDKDFVPTEFRVEMIDNSPKPAEVTMTKVEEPDGADATV